MREPYLARLALGRSAFEPTNVNATVVTPHYVQLGPNGEIPDVVRQSDAYIQLYDHRGNPINPQADDHGRRLRRAQNDIQAAFGVVQRHPGPPVEATALDQPEAEKDQASQAEDKASSLILQSFTYARCAAGWWTVVLRDRLLTFGLRDVSSTFLQVIASQWQISGPALLYGGLPIQFCHLWGANRARQYVAMRLRPLDRLLWNMHATRSTTVAFARWHAARDLGLDLLFAFSCYPFAYHSILQRLGLVPATVLLPPLKSLIPFSQSSPLTLLSFPSELSASSLLDLVKYATTSPLLFYCLKELVKTRCYEVAVRLVARCMDSSARCLLNVRVSRIITRGLVLLGLSRHADREDIAVEGGRISNLQRLNIRPVHSAVETAHNQGEATGDSGGQDAEAATGIEPPEVGSIRDAFERPHSDAERDDSIVTSELHTHAAPLDASTSRPALRPFRTTLLGQAPPIFLIRIITFGTMHWAMMPLDTIINTLVASQHLAHHHNRVLYGNRFVWIPDPLFEWQNLSLRSVGVLLSRLALCQAFKFAIDIGLWGCQWATTVYIGRKHFSWYKL